MSGVSLPVTRPVGRGLLVGNPASRSGPLAILERLGFTCAEQDDPYSAMRELCRQPSAYSALILSLNSLYREELSLIASAKRRLPHLEIWLCHTEGRLAALAEAMRLGADGLLAEDGLQRTAIGAPPADAEGEASHPGQEKSESKSAPERPERSAAPAADHDLDDARMPLPEAVLTAEELRALLQEQPSAPPDL